MSKASSSLCTAACENLSTISSLHSLSETVFLASLTLLWLISTNHAWHLLYSSAIAGVICYIYAITVTQIRLYIREGVLSTIFFKYFTVFCNFSKRLPKRFVMCGWNYYKKLSTGCGNISPTVKQYSLKLRYICGQMRYTPACAICPSDEKIIPDVPHL